MEIKTKVNISLNSVVLTTPTFWKQGLDCFVLLALMASEFLIKYVSII